MLDVVKYRVYITAKGRNDHRTINVFNNEEKVHFSRLFHEREIYSYYL